MADFDFKMDVSELSLEDIAAWPLYLRALCIAATCLLLMLGVYLVDHSRQAKILNQEQLAEVKLKQSFELKAEQAANVDAYKEQLAQITLNLAGLLEQLPNQTEVPALLEDISALGHANGLEFKLFKPLPETQHDFYAKLPIKIIVQGEYHQVAKFISDVSKLNRIVTLDDFIIKDSALPVGSKPEVKREKLELLDVDLTAHTYRYLQKGA